MGADIERRNKFAAEEAKNGSGKAGLGCIGGKVQRSVDPHFGYAEFLQMQLGPESEMYQDAHEIELAAGQLRALFQEISPIIGQTVPCPHKTMGDRIKAMRWSDKNALERK